MDYPAGKEDLVKHAEEKGVDEKVLSALKDLPNRKYETRSTLTRSSSKP